MARSAVFLDRDGVINRLVREEETGRFESPLHVDDVALLPHVCSAIDELHRAGNLVVCVSNQPAAAKGTVSVEELLAIHDRIVALLADEGALLDAWRLCLHHPAGSVAELSGPCSCRKPAPGMLLVAALDLDIDLAGSWMIGDTDADVVAGQTAGCRTILIEHPESVHKRCTSGSPDQVIPDHRAPDLPAAVRFVTSLGTRST